MRLPKFKFVKTSEERDNKKKTEINKELFNEIEQSEIVNMSSAQFINIVNSALDSERDNLTNDLTEKIVNDIMKILDKMVGSAVHSKIKHALRIAKLKIYESNFGKNENK